MTRAAFGQQIMHVFKIFQVTTLIAGKRDALYILLYGTVHYFINRAVMAQVYYLGTAAL
jgi:hypothetical protein